MNSQLWLEPYKNTLHAALGIQKAVPKIYIQSNDLKS